MAVGGRIEWDRQAVDLFFGPDGPAARALQRQAEKITQGAKRRAPVSPHGSHGRPSGWLRSSIGYQLGHDAEGLYADIGSHAFTNDGRDFDYGLAQEVGNRRVPAQPYLRPALYEDGPR